MRAYVYVDGFNLYYGAVKSSGHRWLDLEKLATTVLPPTMTVDHIRYFTAKLIASPTDPQAAQRQQFYLRALRTLPAVSIHFGMFLRNKKRMALVTPPPNTVEVWNTEEKGSDVNLASWLLMDGFAGRYDVAVVVTDDSDLAEPVRLVRHALNLPVWVLSPRARRSLQLSPPALPAGSAYRPIRPGHLATSQFKRTLSDAAGTFTKPPSW